MNRNRQEQQAAIRSPWSARSSLTSPAFIATGFSSRRCLPSLRTRRARAARTPVGTASTIPSMCRIVDQVVGTSGDAVDAKGRGRVAGEGFVEIGHRREAGVVETAGRLQVFSTDHAASNQAKLNHGVSARGKGRDPGSRASSFAVGDRALQHPESAVRMDPADPPRAELSSRRPRWRRRSRRRVSIWLTLMSITPIPRAMSASISLRAFEVARRAGGPVRGRGDRCGGC